MTDIFEQARQKIGSDLIHSFYNSEGSYTRAGEYWTLSPLRSDNSEGSFHIKEDTGLWFDHVTEEGGDFIKLVSLTEGISLKEAAEKIIKESGETFVTSGVPKKKKVFPDPIIIPDNEDSKHSLTMRVNEKWCRNHWGTPIGITRYKNEIGEWVFSVCRFAKTNIDLQKKDSKNDILFYLAEDGKWYSHWHEKLKPFPPLGIEKIKENNLPFLIVEGEKCGKINVPGYNVISWFGGVNNVDKTRWEKIKTRECVIWTDADSLMDKNKEYFLPKEIQPGMKSSFYLKSQIPRAKILEIYRAKPLEENPKGWDIADHVKEGGDPVEFINEYLPYNSLSVAIDPYQVYRAFIENFYDYDSLEQAGGWFWHYQNKKHFWTKTVKNDIHCNFQRWLEDTGLQWVISKKQKATTFINDTKQYIDRHSLGYVFDNSFKDSAISPYIHLKNGAIQITKEKIKWIQRNKYGEDYFKKLYPITCLNFDFDFETYKTIDPEKDCPAFYFFIKEMIPRKYMENQSEDKKKEIINDTLLFLSQIIAYALSPVKPNEYFFGIYGGQRTGKSFLIDIIRSIIGEDFCVETPITNMEHRFASASLWGKKIYIEPDLKTRKSLPEDFIKAYAGDQTITVEEKNQPPIHGVKISMAMFFISNYEFHAKGIEGLARRLVMVPYKNNIKKHDTRLLDKILGKYPHEKESGEKEGKIFDERSAILGLAMQGWESFCKNDHCIEIPEWAMSEKDLWLLESNSVAKFLDEKYFSVDFDGFILRTEIYIHYKGWSEEEGRKPLGKKNFFEEVRRDDRISDHKKGGMDHFIFKEKINSMPVIGNDPVY